MTKASVFFGIAIGLVIGASVSVLLSWLPTLSEFETRQVKSQVTFASSDFDFDEAELEGRGGTGNVNNNGDDKSTDHHSSATPASTEESSLSSSVLFYPQDPSKFIQILLDCRVNPKCHLLYHHIQKTAGSFIASKLYPLFDDDGKRYISGEWCCFQKFMEPNFWKDPEEYCARRGMGVYEVWGNEFQSVMEECSKYAGDGNEDHTYVALASTREPIQRTVSLIHQQCNTGYHVHSPKYQKYCRNCQYNDGSLEGSEVFWDRFVNDTNKAYSTLHSYIQDHDTATLQQKQKMPLLVIDASMLNDFFEKLRVGLVQHHALHPQSAQPPKIRAGVVNPESRSICNFGITSPMLKGLKPSISTYFDLLKGRGL